VARIEAVSYDVVIDDERPMQVGSHDAWGNPRARTPLVMRTVVIARPWGGQSFLHRPGSPDGDRAYPSAQMNAATRCEATELRIDR
jgi:hypothetical protein